ncbi:MAG: hypothetical protein L0Y72_00105 [Gemmataceae bacterium]|nr:hypothetical protein [Gemmataceae bacterium]MCI0737412.1 hypothetical protein [Gemmataceae bacterium]
MRVWDASGKEQHLLKKHEDIVHAISWNPNSTRVLSAGMDGLLCLWDVQTAALIRFRNLSRLEAAAR